MGIRTISLAAAFAVVGCGAPSVTPASQNQAKLRMLVMDPVITSSDTDCKTEALKRTFPAELRNALLSAGYNVAAADAQYDVKWSIHLNVSDCMAMMDNRALVGTVELSADTSDGVLYTGKVSNGVGFALQGNWAQGVVNDFTHTQAVANYALRPRSEPSASPPVARTSPPAAAASNTKLRAGPIRGNAYALVVGVEKYRDLPAPTGARADAQHFADLAKTTLGVPADHVRLALDERATKADLERELGWVLERAPAGGRIYFFYAGHGAPDAAQGTPYLVPYDGDPKYVAASALPLTTVLDTLGKSKAQDVIAFVDACFSGAGGRSVLPPGARPLVRMKELPSSTTGGAARVAVLSSAGGSEISGPTRAGGEGLFTHVLLDALGTGAADIDGDGNISLAEVATWVKPRVAREASQDRREQNPTLTTGAGLGDPSSLIVTGGLAP